MQRFLRFLVLVSTTALANCGAPEERYELSGEVVAIDRERGRVSVNHEAIPGFMDAMTMPFRVKDRRLLRVMSPGDDLKATLVVKGNASWLEDLVASRGVAEGSVVADVTPVGPKIGSTVLDVELINQDAQPIRLSEFQGKALLITFIYTRCPLVDYCPKMNHQFSEVEKLLYASPRLYEKSHLLTISFDPEFDTPELLRTFALQQPGGSERTLEHWSFATGTQENLRALGFYLGLSYRNAEEQIVHNLRTALVAPDGTLAKAYNGNDWTSQEVLDDVAESLTNSDYTRTKESP